ncbi:hypothetical protein CR513_34387, partial [Mucuna pruriens]
RKGKKERRFKQRISTPIFCLIGDSLVEESTQGTFISHGCENILTIVIGRLKHLGCVWTTGRAMELR